MSTPCFICETGIEELRVGPDLRPLPCNDCLTASKECLEEMIREEQEEREAREEGKSLEEYLSTKRKYDV